MAKMKKCFGVALDNRFAEIRRNLSERDWKDRLECHACPDLERCAAIMTVTLQLRQLSNRDLL